MQTPIVNELPLKLEPVTRDDFIDAPRVRARAVRLAPGFDGTAPYRPKQIERIPFGK